MKANKTTFNLSLLLLGDLSRNLLPLLLFVAVLGSAIAVVLSAHNTRQLWIEHEKLIQQKDQLDVEWRHLVIEQSALTEHNRIEQLVSDTLNMRRPTADDEVLVRVK